MLFFFLKVLLVGWLWKKPTDESRNQSHQLILKFCCLSEIFPWLSWLVPVMERLAGKVYKKHSVPTHFDNCFQSSLGGNAYLENGTFITFSKQPLNHLENGFVNEFFVQYVFCRTSQYRHTENILVFGNQQYLFGNRLYRAWHPKTAVKGIGERFCCLGEMGSAEMRYLVYLSVEFIPSVNFS